jgi:polysaccharide export outer membrane protein
MSYLRSEMIFREHVTGGRWLRGVVAGLLGVYGAGCSSFLPTSGPTASSVREASPHPRASEVRVHELSPDLVSRMVQRSGHALFSEQMRRGGGSSQVIGEGDSLEITIFEAPPASLFTGATILEAKGGVGGSKQASFPDQMVAQDGTIRIPFAGHLEVRGRTLREVEEMIFDRLKDKANQPQVMVKQTRNLSTYVTVLGEVNASLRMPLTPARERIMDALAAAGGTKGPVNKMTVQIARGGTVMSLPMETIIANPSQNLELKTGDIVTVVSQPLSFTVLGATARNEEIYFEAKGINLAQAIARAGGMSDSRASSRGVFIFRWETPKEHEGLTGATTRISGPSAKPGRVPVVYCANFRDPRTFFLAKEFPMKDGDLLFVSNAPAAELQKFVNIVASIAFPAMNFAVRSQTLTN